MDETQDPIVTDALEALRLSHHPMGKFSQDELLNEAGSPGFYVQDFGE